MRKRAAVLSLVSLVTFPPLVSAADAISAPRRAPRVPPTVSAITTRPQVEVAFVLDTTGSMSALIEGAKRRIWSVARRIGEGQPRPDLRIALVAYRDRGDLYVTQVHDFTPDMDAVYARLRSFEADGGGDTPEHVSAAMEDAVHKLSWSNGNGLRVIFLVGDAPPHLDYQDGYHYTRAVAAARQKGIAVEAIQCGADPQTARFWREIAGLGGGHYAQIDGSGGMPTMVTAHDGELARLNRELASTVVVGGSVSERKKGNEALAARAAMPAAAAVEAAGYYAKAPSLASHDLVDKPEAAQRQELSGLVGRADAPKEIQGKTDAEALVYLKLQKERRVQIQKRIDTLQKERDAKLEQAGAKDAFDEKVVQSLKDRAAAEGIKY